MSKVFGCFVLKYAEPQLPWEIHEMIVSYLQSTQLLYLIERCPNCNWEWKYISDLDVFQKYPKKDWDYGLLSENANLTVDIIKKHPNKFHLWYLSERASIDDIENNIDLDWVCSSIAKNPNLTAGFIKKYSDEKIIDWYNFRYFENFSLETIEKNPDIPWCRCAHNTLLTIKDIEKHNEDCDWYYLSRVLPIDVIKRNLDKPIKWDLLPYNQTLTMEFIEDAIDAELWGWDQCHVLSKHKNLTMEFVEKYIHKKWDWNGLCNHSNITPKFIRNHINDKIKTNIFSMFSEENYCDITPNGDTYLLNFYSLSKNSGLTMDIVDEYDRPWNWTKLSENINIDIDFIKKYKYKKWNFTYLMTNPSLSTKDKVWICRNLK